MGCICKSYSELRVDCPVHGTKGTYGPEETEIKRRIQDAVQTERRRMMSIVARDEFYPTMGCMEEMRAKIVDAINAG